MILDAINRLVQLGQETQKAQFVAKPGDPHATLVIRGDNPIEEIAHEKTPLDVQVRDMGSLFRFLGSHLISAGYEVWFDTDQIVIILDADDRRLNRVSLNLYQHPVFMKLAKTLVTDCPKKFKLWVKTIAGTCAYDPPNLLDMMAEIRFSRTDEQTHIMHTNSDTMGREIRNAVSGLSQIPEVVSFSFLPFPALEEQFQEEVTVPCTLWVDPAERQIHLFPFDGALQEAERLAVRRLMDRAIERYDLEEDDVYFGSP